jgi:hypothetical protein
MKIIIENIIKMKMHAMTNKPSLANNQYPVIFVLNIKARIHCVTMAAKIPMIEQS